MIEEIFRDIYKIEIPLPNNPLRVLNSYVIKNSDRDLIVDTGFNREECLTAMQAGLKELEVDLRKTDFYITHLHADHIGLLANLAKDTSTIYFNETDADMFKSGSPWQDFFKFASLNGFPENELQAVLQSHPALKYRLKEDLDFHVLREGDVIPIGDKILQCIETPGHTRGHMCLYEPSQKIFFAGDHILDDITPTIQLWSDEWDPLKEYLESLDKVEGLDIELVLPGHRSILRNCKERIQALKCHHQVRLDEIISILQRGRQSAFQIASQMSWDIFYDSWDLFPASQKWFATGEAIAHLKYLEENGSVQRDRQSEKTYFYL